MRKAPESGPGTASGKAPGHGVPIRQFTGTGQSPNVLISARENPADLHNNPVRHPRPHLHATESRSDHPSVS